MPRRCSISWLACTRSKLSAANGSGSFRSASTTSIPRARAAADRANVELERILGRGLQRQFEGLDLFRLEFLGIAGDSQGRFDVVERLRVIERGYELEPGIGLFDDSRKDDFWQRPLLH